MPRKMIRTLGAAMLCGALLPVASAIAAQGPGAGTGSAGDLTRMTMAILVYGTAAGDRRRRADRRAAAAAISVSPDARSSPCAG